MNQLKIRKVTGAPEGFLKSDHDYWFKLEEEKREEDCERWEIPEDHWAYVLGMQEAGFKFTGGYQIEQWEDDTPVYGVSLTTFEGKAGYEDEVKHIIEDSEDIVQPGYDVQVDQGYKITIRMIINW